MTGSEIRVGCSKITGFSSYVEGQGVNYCSVHCRLAKIRGLMYGGKYSDVIGIK